MKTGESFQTKPSYFECLPSITIPKSCHDLRFLKLPSTTYSPRLTTNARPVQLGSSPRRLQKAEPQAGDEKSEQERDGKGEEGIPMLGEARTRKEIIGQGDG